MWVMSLSILQLLEQMQLEDTENTQKPSKKAAASYLWGGKNKDELSVTTYIGRHNIINFEMMLYHICHKKRISLHNESG